jgi:hypothetical protein
LGPDTSPAVWHSEQTQKGRSPETPESIAAQVALHRSIVLSKIFRHHHRATAGAQSRVLTYSTLEDLGGADGKGLAGSELADPNVINWGEQKGLRLA